MALFAATLDAVTAPADSVATVEDCTVAPELVVVPVELLVPLEPELPLLQPPAIPEFEPVWAVDVDRAD